MVYEGSIGKPYCSVFPSLDLALAYARQQVEIHPTLRCRIFDTSDFFGAPIADLRETEYKDNSKISARFADGLEEASSFLASVRF